MANQTSLKVNFIYSFLLCAVVDGLKLPNIYVPHDQLSRSETLDGAGKTYAIAVPVCMGVDYLGHSPEAQLQYLEKFINCLPEQLPKEIDVVVLSHGFSSAQILHSVRGDARIKNLESPVFPFKSRYHPEDGLAWPSNDHVQARTDGLCTTVKFNAWNLNYDAIALVDDDVCLRDTNGFLKAFEVFVNSGRDIQAEREKAQRPKFGLNTHMAFLKANSTHFHNLVHKAATGDFMPYTNTEQDVIESYFGSNPLEGFPWPGHVHSKTCTCKG